MKEYLGDAVNLSYIEDDDGTKRKLKAAAEIILIVTEPVFRADAAGHMTRQREVETLRFGASLKGIQSLIKRLSEFASEMEEMESRFIERHVDA